MRNIDGTPILKLLNEVVGNFGFKKKDLLHVNASDFFGENFKFSDQRYFDESKDHVFMPDEIKTDKFNRKFKMIFGDFPWSCRNLGHREASIQSLKFLDSNGIGIFLMPHFFMTFKNNARYNYLKEIKGVGFKVLAIIQMPVNFMRPYTGMQSTLVFLSQDNGIEETYFAKYEDLKFQPKKISLRIKSLFGLEMRKHMDHHEPKSAKITKEIPEIIEKEANFYDGIEENLDNFVGFEYWEQDKEIRSLDTEYGGYKFVKLSELVEINSTREVFEDLENAVYIPAIGRTEVLETMPTLLSKKKPKNYFQIVCNPTKILNKYLFIFLNSELGQKTIERELSKYSDSTIKRLRLGCIKNLYIPLPNLGVQEEIIDNISKLKKITELLNNIEKDLSIKPISSSDQLAKLEQIYNSSIKLSEPERVFNDIKKGESKDREFKQTFVFDMKSKTRNPALSMKCGQAVAALMNTDGGNLYIGVADNKDISGIEIEVGKTKIYKSLDQYINTIKEFLKSKIESVNLINCDFLPVKIRGKQILKIKCKASDHQVFFKNDKNRDTYVRMGPSTNKLEGPDLVTFSKENFK